MAGEIARLLNGNVKLGSRRVEPRDIAYGDHQCRGATRAGRIALGADPERHLQQRHVFKSPEAAELARILAASPSQRRRDCQGALTTERSA